MVRPPSTCVLHDPSPPYAEKAACSEGVSVRLCAQYNTYSTHYKEVDCLREQIEPFLYNVGVDIILHGEHTCHAHSHVGSMVQCA